jgi:hypothetical protein
VPLKFNCSVWSRRPIIPNLGEFCSLVPGTVRQYAVVATVAASGQWGSRPVLFMYLVMLQVAQWQVPLYVPVVAPVDRSLVGSAWKVGSAVPGR